MKSTILADSLERLKKCLISGYKTIDHFFHKTVSSKAMMGLVIVLSFIFIYILNAFQPVFADDWNYAFLSVSGTSNERITTFSQILQSQYEHYHIWGGRSVLHTIAQWLLMINAHCADLINSLVYILFTLVIYVHTNYRKQANPSLLVVINLCLWFMLGPIFGATTLWLVGSANYLWGAFIVLLFFLPYRIYAQTDKVNNGYVKMVGLFLFGIIAGWTNENMAVALIATIIFLLTYLHLKNGTTPKWAIAGLLGFIIGAGMMILAPGNYARYIIDTGVSPSEHLSVSVILARVQRLAFTYYQLVMYPVLIYTLLLVCYRKFAKRADYKVNLNLSFVFLFFSTMATFAMLAAPDFPPRATFGIITCVVISICMLYANINLNISFVRAISNVVIAGMIVFFAGTFMMACVEANKSNRILENRLKVIEEQKKEGVRSFHFKGTVIKPNTTYYYYYELRPNSTDWHNRMYSKYYGIESITVSQ